jgi:hypothetical protein
MPFIGNKPTAVPLSGADLEDDIITSAKISDGTITASDLDLTDNYDFTGTVTGAGGANTPAFHAYLSSNQSVSSATFTKAQINTEVYDTDGCYDNSTNYRFTPTTAGKYFFYGMVFVDGSSAGGTNGQLITEIRKNGSSAAYSTIFIRSYTSGVDGALNVFNIIDMNGSSDYVEMFSYNKNNGTNNFVAGIQNTFFGGYKIIE